MENKIVYEAQNSFNKSFRDSEHWYQERVNRNLGWITQEEQVFLRNCTIGIAGCGGMGGLLAATFVRLGIGELRIADCENFDVSNLNRQFAATQFTVGKSKALETARMLREISNDTKLIVYTTGIEELNVQEFSSGCDFICDEIEFWASGSRILLHLEARKRNVPLITCSSVGFGTRLFLFDHKGMSMEDMLKMSLKEAIFLQEKIQNHKATHDECNVLMNSVLNALIPELTRYSAPDSGYDDKLTCVERLLSKQQASIIATNPPLASGFAANHTLLYLLSRFNSREIIIPPLTPGYLYFDSAKMIAKTVERTEVSNEEQH